MTVEDPEAAVFNSRACATIPNHSILLESSCDSSVVLDVCCLPPFNGFLDQFVGCKSNHGRRYRSHQFQSKSPVQSLQNISIGFGNKGLGGTENGRNAAGRGTTRLDASLKQYDII